MPGLTNNALEMTWNKFDSMEMYTKFAPLCLPSTLIQIPQGPAGRQGTNSIQTQIEEALAHFGSVVPHFETITGPVCTTVAEIYYFLTTLKTRPSCMILRQEVPLNPAFLFRIFVHNRAIIAVSQVDTSACYPFLEPLADEIRYEIDEFYENHLQYQLPMESCTIDVYVPYPCQRVWMLELNEYGSGGKMALFAPSELARIEKAGENVDDFEYELRLVSDS